MKKLEEINRLVDEAFESLENAQTCESEKQILRLFARKCAEINMEDFCLIRKYTVGDNIEAYNSRLRDGQVEEVKQEEKPALQPLPSIDELANEICLNTATLKPNVSKDIAEYLCSKYGTQQSNLQPLPDEVPEWFITSWKNTSGDITMRIEEWHKIVDHFGTPPREWWMDLNKGDKFMCEDGLRTFNGKYSCIDGYFFLYTIEEGDIGLNADYCSPYTDPAQSFRSKLTPEMQVEFDKLVEGVGK